MSEESGATRRDFLASLVMGGGLLLAYGALAIQGLLFLLPKRLQPKTRLMFVGRTDQFSPGQVKTYFDLEGNAVLVKRGAEGFEAFSSTCPHLGCRVHWEAEEQRFFCPCHRGVFDADGVGVSGPPYDAGQELFRANLRVDDLSGVIYLEVRDRGSRTA